MLLPIASGWWFKPDFIINELNINSAVSRPWHDEVLPLGTNNMYTMNGYAYTGGQRIWVDCTDGTTAKRVELVSRRPVSQTTAIIVTWRSVQWRLRLQQHIRHCRCTH